MPSYYNENDKQKAAWLRELISRNLIAPGEVDERSIKEVSPKDISGFAQCHFFAGIGVWSYALRLAGWPDDREVWTGSCPCQSFSVAGKRQGFADERHLWPDWFRLISERKPRVVFGEQSASKDALAWLDLVQSNLEEAGYALGALDLCAAGFGAPHIRQRLYFVADASNERHDWRRASETSRGGERSTESRCSDDLMGDSERTGLARRSRQQGHNGSELAPTERTGGATGGVAEPTEARRNEAGEHGGGPSLLSARPEQCSGIGGVADANGGISSDGAIQRRGEYGQQPQDRGAGFEDRRTGPTNGFWRDADWLRCTDGKWRPVRSSSFPLVNGAAARVGRLRGYGDAIVAEQARAFIEAYLEISRA